MRSACPRTRAHRRLREAGRAGGGVARDGGRHPATPPLSRRYPPATPDLNVRGRARSAPPTPTHPGLAGVRSRGAFLRKDRCAASLFGPLCTRRGRARSGKPAKTGGHTRPIRTGGAHERSRGPILPKDRSSTSRPNASLELVRHRASSCCPADAGATGRHGRRIGPESFRSFVPKESCRSIRPPTMPCANLLPPSTPPHGVSHGSVPRQEAT